MAIVESVGQVLVGQPNVYLKTLLKIGIGFGQIKAPFQLPQPDDKGLLQDSFSRLSSDLWIIHQLVCILLPIAVLLIPRN